MACKKLLILSGPTYPTRLWCAWEMYVFFAMATDTARLELKPLDGSHDTLEQLKHFSAANAHCWSEQDEAMLRGIIGDDVPRFENEIRQVASMTRAKDQNVSASLGSAGARCVQALRRAGQSQGQGLGSDVHARVRRLMGNRHCRSLVLTL